MMSEITQPHGRRTAEGWEHYEKLVLAHLGRQDTTMMDFGKKLEDLKVVNAEQNVVLHRVEETLNAHLSMHRDIRKQMTEFATNTERRLSLVEAGAVRNSGMVGALMAAVVYVVMFFVGKLWRI